MENPYAPPRRLDQQTRPRLTLAKWFERVIAGLIWGWIWGSLVIAAWLGLAVAAYGDISRASEVMKTKEWAPFALTAMMGSVLGSYVGGFVAPLSIGAATCRVRRPVLRSSFYGAALGAVIGAMGAAVAEWFCVRYAPRSMLGMKVSLGLSLPVGVVAGWLGGRAVLGDSPATVDQDGHATARWWCVARARCVSEDVGRTFAGETTGRTLAHRGVFLITWRIAAGRFDELRSLRGTVVAADKFETSSGSENVAPSIPASRTLRQLFVSALLIGSYIAVWFKLVGDQPLRIFVSFFFGLMILGAAAELPASLRLGNRKRSINLLLLGVMSVLAVWAVWLPYVDPRHVWLQRWLVSPILILGLMGSIGSLVPVCAAVCGGSLASRDRGLEIAAAALKHARRHWLCVFAINCWWASREFGPRRSTGASTVRGVFSAAYTASKAGFGLR